MSKETRNVLLFVVGFFLFVSLGIYREKVSGIKYYTGDSESSECSDAYEEGYNDGHGQGYDEGYAAGRHSYVFCGDNLDELLESLQEDPEVWNGVLEKLWEDFEKQLEEDYGIVLDNY